MESHHSAATIIRNTKRELRYVLQRRLANLVRKHLESWPGYGRNLKVTQATRDVRDDDFEIVFIKTGSRLTMQAAHLTCPRKDQSSQCNSPSGTVGSVFIAPGCSKLTQPFALTSYHVSMAADLSSAKTALKGTHTSWSDGAISHAAWAAYYQTHCVPQNILTIPCARAVAALQLQRECLSKEYFSNIHAAEHYMILKDLQANMKAIACPSQAFCRAQVFCWVL